MPARALRLVSVEPHGRYGVLHLAAAGDAADWNFRKLPDVHGPTWELVRLEKGKGATLTLVVSLGDHAHGPLCTCGKFQGAGSCDHLAALHALAGAGKLA